MKTSFSSSGQSWRRAITRIVTISPVIAALAVITISCSEADRRTVVLGETEVDGGSNTPLTPSGDGAASLPDASQAMCPTSACPPGRATCADHPFPCEVDVLSDNAHCGACGQECPTYPGGHATTNCVDGACVFQCTVDPARGAFANCNGLLEDGCEVNLSTDKNNCGACGSACPSDQVCDHGQCVCGIANSCGTCGNVCPPPTGLPTLPRSWHATYGCRGGQCNQPTCSYGYDDCNGDLGDPSGDGCETPTTGDPEHCGGCGIKCEFDSICYYGTCICKCGSSCYEGLGGDLDSDPANCGACGVRCDVSPPPPATEPVCNHGMCESRCVASHADCDHDLGNGCETNILSDPLNCGGCGVRCDGIEGQACIEGHCTMTECDIK